MRLDVRWPDLVEDCREPRCKACGGSQSEGDDGEEEGCSKEKLYIWLERQDCSLATVCR